MSYIDMGSITSGMTSTAQAIGAISELGQKIKYGDREAEAEIRSKEAAATQAELAIKESQYRQAKEQRLDNEKKLGVELRSNILNMQTLQKEQQAKRNGLIDYYSDTSMKVAPTVFSTNTVINDLLSKNDFTSVKEYTKTVDAGASLITDFMKNGSLDADKYAQAQDYYSKLNSYANQTYVDPKSIGFQFGDDGKIAVTQIDPKTGVQKVLDQDAIGTTKSLLTQTKVTDDWVNQMIANGYDKVDDDTRNYLGNVRTLQNISQLLPAEKGKILFITASGVTDPNVQQSLINKGIEQVQKHLDSSAMQTAIKMIRDIPVVGEVSGKQLEGGNTFGRVMDNLKDANALHRGFNNIADTIQNDPRYEKLKQYMVDNSITIDQVRSAIYDPQIKAIKDAVAIRKTEAETVKDLAQANEANASAGYKSALSTLTKQETSKAANFDKTAIAYENLAAKTMDPTQKAEYTRLAAQFRNNAAAIRGGTAPQGPTGDMEVPLPGKGGAIPTNQTTPKKSSIGDLFTNKNKAPGVGGDFNKNGDTVKMKEQGVQVGTPKTKEQLAYEEAARKYTESIRKQKRIEAEKAAEEKRKAEYKKSQQSFSKIGNNNAFQ